MDQYSLDLLKELTEASGLPGYEGEIRDIIAKRAKGLAEVSRDRIGNIYCKKQGASAGPRIILPGHMDEIGFVVNAVTDDGYIRFTPLGGWWDHVIMAQRVTLRSRKGDMAGIVGSKPPHNLKPDEREKLIKRQDMFIDVGAKDKADAEGKYGIRIGDPIIPICPFTQMRNRKLLMAKAFDDRVGVALFLDALRKLGRSKHPNTVYGVGTVMEEVGLRGAAPAANTVEPDVALVLDVGLASDTPGCRAEDKSKGTLGDGVQICFLDSGMVPNLKLRDFLVDLAEEKRIPYQVYMLERGATDGARIHIHGQGVPTVYLGVPTRYIHSHAGIMHSDDYDSAVKLLVEAIKRLDRKTANSLKP